MTTPQDCSIGLATESTYGTAVVPTRWYEFIDESLDFNKSIKQGVGLRVGGRVARSARRVVPTADAGGDFSLEVTSKGMGLLWQACLGTGVSTLVLGTTFQQNFTLGDTPTSVTLQKGLARADGTVDAYNFVGAMVDQWEFTFANADIAKLKVTWDAKDVATPAYTAPSYAASPNLFHFAGASLSTGALTAPTATALASAATPVADVKGGVVTVNNNVAGDRYLIGGAGRKAKPTMGLRTITGKLDVEYDNTTFRDAVLQDTPLALVLTYTAAALSTGNETLQIVLPEVKIDSQLPVANGGDLIVAPLSFTVLDNLTAAQPIWVIARTADSAL